MCCIVHSFAHIFALHFIRHRKLVYKQKQIRMATNVENSKAQMRKGVLEFCILSVLADGEAYPSDIIDRLKESKLIVVEGTLYPLLTRLKNDNLLSYRWEESSSGPPRKYYKLTEQGKEVMTELLKAWEELVNSVNKTLKR